MNVLTAFDSDVLIYASVPGHPLGGRVAALFNRADDEVAGTGSLLLMTEVLAKPRRADPGSHESVALTGYLARLDLQPVDAPVARTALALAVSYGLSTVDATHLATAVVTGADRFLTNNRRDFPKTISEIDIVYPDELPPVG